MRIAIHQPNFMPWFPFFEKMAQSDLFVVQVHCQFEKQGYQNRAMVNGKWWTNPVKNGEIPIKDKFYADGNYLLEVNLAWIKAMALTLGISTKKIVYDFPTEKTGTDRIVEICKHYGADEYLTNPDATEKYLEKSVLEKNGVTLVPFVSRCKKHVFELFAEIGIEKTKGMLKHREIAKAAV